jgi:hypothetical protein
MMGSLSDASQGVCMSVSDELRLHHIQTIQGVVNRLSQYSFAVRGWSVTLVSVIFAFMTTQRGSSVVLTAALAPVIIFWGMDAFYVRRERLYRQLFEAVARDLASTEPATLPLFSMDVSPFVSRVPSWLRTMTSATVVAIPLMLGSLVLAYAIAKG